jgi:hypothetical protein
MSDMKPAIAPKSDQLNADDLISGPITITVTGVTVKGGQEQPVAISYEGDNGKPYKACKSMCRVLVSAWGSDSKQYVGRAMTLYRDPHVKWAGMEVGGIRISHLSHLDRDMTMALTATRGSKKLFTVSPLLSLSSISGAVAQTKSTEPETSKLKRELWQLTATDHGNDKEKFWNFLFANDLITEAEIGTELSPERLQQIIDGVNKMQP